MKVGLVGYGKMGSGIFRLLAGKDFEVVVFGRDQSKCADNEAKYFKSLERAVKRGRLSQDEYLNKRRSIRFSSQFEDLAPCDLVIESAVEDYTAKAAIFRQLEAVVRPDAALATNTSSISIRRLAQNLAHPDRFCGLHFFYPVPLIDLVEIIRADSTPAGLIDTLKSLCTVLGKKCILVEDAPGSVINAILAYYYLESLYVLEEGRVGPSTIDQLAKRFFYVGPCESMDMVGIDFMIDALKRSATTGTVCPLHWVLRADGSLPPGHVDSTEGFFAPALLTRLLDSDRLGRKTGRGIYLYDHDKPYDDELSFYHSPKAPYLAPGEQSDELIEMRLLHAVFNGSIECLAKGMAVADDIDIGVREILQMRDGPFTMMRSMGRGKCQERCDELALTVGERYRQNHLSILWD